MFPLKVHERNELVKASRQSVDAIERAIETIRQRNPQAFHTESSLFTRVFYDQPLRQEPCKGFIRQNGRLSALYSLL